MRRLDWTNTIFMSVAHVVAVVAIVYMAAVHFSWWTLGLGVVWFELCGIAVTGGYHRLFAHRAYEANGLLRALYLAFGAASAQNSVLLWAADHRVHHAHTDQEQDPYNISLGFWWAHVGWVLHKRQDRHAELVPDLSSDPLVRFQARFYVPLAVLFGVLIPGALGLLWGDPIGAMLVAGFLRLVVQWHATFTINSVAHVLGSQPYGSKTTARDSMWTALMSFGEGYHNFHHRFQNDYRNGVRWFHFDPTKWFIFSLSKVGVTRMLKRTPTEAIRRAREAVAGLRPV